MICTLPLDLFFLVCIDAACLNPYGLVLNGVFCLKASHLMCEPRSIAALWFFWHMPDLFSLE